MLDLEPIKKRCEAATAAPWKNGNPGQMIFHDGKLVGVVPIQKHNDAEFMAQARQDIPALITEVELYRKEISKLAKDNERLRQERNEKSISQGRITSAIKLRSTTFDGIPVVEYRWGGRISVYVDDELTEDSYDDAVEKLKAGVE